MIENKKHEDFSIDSVLPKSIKLLSSVSSTRISSFANLRRRKCAHLSLISLP